MADEKRKKVPIEVPDDSAEELDQDVELQGENTDAPEDAPSIELDEDAMVEAAIRAGEEAAEKDALRAEEAKAARTDELAARVEELEMELEAVNAVAAEAQDRVTRVQADWENFRRRTATELEAERERAAEGVVSDILPAIDDLERAVEHARQAAGSDADVATQLADGVDAVRQKIVDVLAKRGVEQINPVGEAFDPLAHQAVGRVEDADELSDTVRDVYQLGYRMAGKVIRPAMVTVTHGGPEREVESAEDAPETTPNGESQTDE